MTLKRIIKILVYITAVSVVFTAHGVCGSDAFANGIFNANDVRIEMVNGDKGNICYGEAPQFNITVLNPQNTSITAVLSYTVSDDLGISVCSDSILLTVNAQTELVKRLKIDCCDYGVYTLSYVLTSESFSTITGCIDYSVVFANESLSSETGVATHFAFQNREQPADSIGQITNAGFGWIRDELYWRDCETSKGSYSIPGYAEEYVEYASQNNLNVIMILNAPNQLYDNGGFPSSDEAIAAFAGFCGYAAEALKGKVETFEIWNEPNLKGFTGDVPIGGSEYTALLKAAYASIKAANPSATVLGGSLTAMKYGSEVPDCMDACDFLQEMLDAGAGDYMDAFSFHPYTYKNYHADETDITFTDNLEIAESILDAAGADDMQIWLTEYGKQRSEGRSRRYQANDTVRSTIQSRADSRVARIIIYNYKAKGIDDVNEAEYSFGIVDYNQKGKPQFAALSFENAFLEGSTYSDCYVQSTIASRIYSIYHFTAQNTNEDKYVLWDNARNADTDGTIVFSAGDEFDITVGKSIFGITLSDSDKAVIYDIYGNEINTFEKSDLSSDYSLDITDEPIYVEIRHYSFEILSDGDTIRVNGVTDGNRDVTLLALTDISSFSQIAYVQQASSDENGKFSFEFKLPERSCYKILVYDSRGIRSEEYKSSGFDIKYRFYQMGAELTDYSQISKASPLTVTLDVTADTETDDLIMLGVVYNGRGLETLDSNSIVWSDLTHGSASIDIPLDEDVDVERLKLMLWSSGLKPVCSALEIGGR